MCRDRRQRRRRTDATESRSTTIERFRRRSHAAGAEVTRVEPAAAGEELANRCSPPVVATALPWPDVSLPESATTMPSPAELANATTGITPATCAIADYGSVVLRSTADGVEPVSLFPRRHVVVVRTEDVVPDVPSALGRFGDAFRNEGASAIVATGPSATADMGALVTGAHGPTEVHVVLVGGDADR